MKYGVDYGVGKGEPDTPQGRKPLDELRDSTLAAQYNYLQTWEKRVILAVVNNESKIFEAINSYDSAYLTAGMIQWATNDKRGELPGILSTLPDADFQRLFGVWGLGTTDVIGRPFKDVVAGYFTLDGTKLDTHEQKDELRGFRWAYRFSEAAKDNVYRDLQVLQAHTRIGAMLRIPLQWGKEKITAESVLQSELLRALALDEHVNAGQPAIKYVLQRLMDGMKTPAKIITINADGTFAGVWYEQQREPNFMKRASQKQKQKRKKFLR